MDNCVHYTCSSKSLKGQCHEMKNFLKVLKIKSVPTVYALMVLNFFASELLRKKHFKFKLASR